MKICIIGVARSGTTALYHLLQEIMLDNCDNKVEFAYEPFLWEKEYFNDRFDLVNKHFNFMDSISFQGIHNHLKLPMLIDDPIPFKDNEYLKNLFNPCGGNHSHILLKFIRASGRYLLLNAISPDTKFIFIIRNPADSVNSIAFNFSFYGGEFHRDDFSRFLNDVNCFFKTNRGIESFETRAEKELFYWYYMNRFAIESFARASSHPLILCHEEVKKRRDQCVQSICDYLDVPVKSYYRELFRKDVGPVIKEKKASRGEVKLYRHYLRMYTQLLESHSIGYDFEIEDILKPYKRVGQSFVQEKPEYGLVPLGIMKRLEEANVRIEQVVKEKDKIIRQKDAQIQKKDDLLSKKNALIGQIRNNAIKRK